MFFRALTLEESEKFFEIHESELAVLLRFGYSTRVFHTFKNRPFLKGAALEPKNSGFDFERRETIIVESKA